MSTGSNLTPREVVKKMIGEKKLIYKRFEKELSRYPQHAVVAQSMVATRHEWELLEEVLFRMEEGE